MTGDRELCVGQHVPVRCHRCALIEIGQLRAALEDCYFFLPVEFYNRIASETWATINEHLRLSPYPAEDALGEQP